MTGDRRVNCSSRGGQFVSGVGGNGAIRAHGRAIRFVGIQIGSKLMPGHASRGFGSQYPNVGHWLAAIEPLPNGTLGAADDASERRLATCEPNGFFESFKGRARISHEQVL